MDMKLYFVAEKKIRAPKTRSNDGEATVGMNVSMTRRNRAARQIGVFHFPRGENFSVLTALQAISKPKTKVVYPTRKIANIVRPYSCCLHVVDLLGSVITAIILPCIE